MKDEYFSRDINLVQDEIVSDESIYAIYRFIEDLVLHFEELHYSRLVRYSRRKEIKKNPPDYL